MITICHMHNLDGSEWNAEIRASVREIVEARQTLLRLHCTLHKTMPFGHKVAPKDAKTWSQWPTCSGQICGRGLIERRPEEFPESIVEELERVKSMNAIRFNQFMYALVLPRRKRRKGHKGVFFEKVKGDA